MSEPGVHGTGYTLRRSLFAFVEKGNAAFGAVMSSPLSRNGFALVGNTVITSVLGVVFWILATHLYSPAEVGVGSILISTLVTIGGGAQFNFANVLNRFVPRAGGRAGKLIVFSYAIAGVASLAAAVVFVIFADRLAPGLAFLKDSPWQAGWFVGAAALWSVFSLQDSALAGLRQSVWVPVENSAYALLKIALLVFLAGAAATGFGLFVAWTLPLIAIVAVINLFMFRVLLPRHARRPGAGESLAARTILNFFGWDYLGRLIFIAALGIAPILVLSYGGAIAAAHYYLAWTIAYSLYLVGRSMGISLLTESAIETERLPALVADTVIQTVIPVTLVAIAIVMGAPILMNLFGQSYAQGGTSLLQVLALSAIPWSLVTIFLAVARARGWLRAIAGVQVVTLIIAIGVGAALLPSLGALGMGIGWLTAHSLVAIGIGGALAIRSGPETSMDWWFGLASSLARLAARLRQPADRSGHTAADDDDVRQALAATGIKGADSWQILRTVPTPNGTSVVLAGEPAEAKAVLKIGRSVAARRSIAQNHDRIDAIQAEPALAALAGKVPRPLAFVVTSAMTISVEQVLPGTDGREVLGDAALRPQALQLAAAAIIAYHAQTATEVTIDHLWLERWIERPLSALENVGGRHDDAIARLRHEQGLFWSGRSLRLGGGHGDFSPGNILFAAPDRHAGCVCAPVELSGIIDWDRALADAPSGFDLCHLALTTRMLRREEELGHVVHQILASPKWDADELSWLAASADPATGWPNEPAAVRAMTSLVWLHHVASNLDKAERYAVSRLWIASNVGRVLRDFIAPDRPK